MITLLTDAAPIVLSPTPATPAKKPRRMFTLEQIEEADEEQCGFCLSCGEMQECCEPDARAYECDSCGAHKVYGAQELVMMGRVSSEA